MFSTAMEQITVAGKSLRVDKGPLIGIAEICEICKLVYSIISICGLCCVQFLSRAALLASLINHIDGEMERWRDR